MSAATTTGLTVTATMTDAEFRAFGSAIAATLDAGGFARTGDTGQINWTTVTWPATAISAGYEIRAMADSLAGTAPIVIKLTYNRVAANQWSIGISVGSGSNGSGTLSGVQMAEQICQMSSNTGTDYNIAVSAGTGRFGIFSWRTSAPNGGSSILVFERTADSNRTINADGSLLFFVSGGGAITSYVRYIPRSGTVPAAETNSNGGIPCFPPYGQTTGLHGSADVAVYPIYAYGVGELRQPFLGVVGAYFNNFTALNSYTVSIRGTNQVMLMGQATSLPTAMWRGSGIANTVFTPMMRYD